MYGLGTIINVVAILVGATIGVLVGHRLPERTRTTVTDALGLVTLVIGGLNVVALRDQAFVDAVGGSATLLIVLGALLIGESSDRCCSWRSDSRTSVAGCRRGSAAVTPAGHGSSKASWTRR